MTADLPMRRAWIGLGVLCLVLAPAYVVFAFAAARDMKYLFWDCLLFAVLHGELAWFCFSRAARTASSPSPERPE